MAFKHTNNEVADVFLQNENLQTQRCIVAHSSNMKTYKNNSSGIKYGLSELSNDKTYLETELPARKRHKPETVLSNPTKCLNIASKAEVNDDEFNNLVNEENNSNVLSNILSSENNPFKKEILRSDLNAEINTQRESSALKSGTCNSVFQTNILANQLKLDPNDWTRKDFEMKSENQDFELHSENNFYKNIDKDKISNRGTESETEFDDEVNKCCELLNLDVPRMSVVSTADPKIANDSFDSKIIKKSEVHKCKIGNGNKKQSLDVLYPQSNKLFASSKTLSNDINLGTVSLGETSKIQDKLLNQKEKNCDDSIKFNYEENSVLNIKVTSSSFLTTSNENCIDINKNFSHNQINLGVEDNLFESGFMINEKYNMPYESDNILNCNNIFVREPNIFIPEMIQSHNNRSNSEHLGLTTEDTLNSDTLKLNATNQIISQDLSNVDKNEIDEVSSAVDDSGDILSLYGESDIDSYETEEISKTNMPEFAIQEETSKKIETVSLASRDCDNKSCTYTCNGVKEEDNLIHNEKNNQVCVNFSLDDKNYESHVLDGILKNDCSTNKNDLDIKVDESFVSEYEISLLAEDTDSILSEESLDSEYEISLLEDDINDEENQNDLDESKPDCNVVSNNLPNDDEDEKSTHILSQESLDPEISLLEDGINEGNRNDLCENISDTNVMSKNLHNGDEKDEKFTALPQGSIKEQENEQIIVGINLPERETDKVISKNKVYSKSISERITDSFPEEKIKFNCNNNQVADITDSDKKISAQKEEMHTISKIKSSENTKESKEDFAATASDKINLRFEKPTNLRSDKPDGVEKEKINNDHFQLKLILNNESQTPNRDELENSKEKTPFMITNKHLADSACTNTATVSKIGKLKTESDEKISAQKEEMQTSENDKIGQDFGAVTGDKINLRLEKPPTVIVEHLENSTCTNTATIAKFVKIELDAPDIGESKANITDEFQDSNKVILNSKTNETKKSGEKVLIANTNKKLVESTFTDKTTGDKTVKTDLGVSACDESKQDVKDIIPDYYEEEKEDLINPGWNKIKELSTDEERYRQVRDCWKSKNIPNPFKNLTYYSYRKRKINRGEENPRQTRQHKRNATSNLKDNNAKRSRSCTYIFDDRIKSIEKEIEIRTKTIQDKMTDEVNRLNELHHQEEMGIQNFYGFGFNPRRQFELNNLMNNYQQRVSSVTAEYEHKVNSCYGQYSSEMNKLKNNRNEVLQFYSFYKGLNTNEYKDPTILTNAQMQELEEIENIYNQMNLQYR